MSRGYIDIHSHALWGMDDGSQSFKETMALCDCAEENGTSTLFLTPHLMYWSQAEELCDERDEKAEELSDELYESGFNLEIKKGFEILCDDEIFNKNYFKPYTLNGSRYILIEFNFFRTTEEDVSAWCDYLLDNGVVPIIAHPERYEFVKNDIGVIDRLSDKGCLFQINAGSPVGAFGDVECDVALQMLFNGYVDFIGSDAHDLRWRTTDIDMFIRDYPEDLEEDLLYIALRENPEKLLNDENIEPERLGYLSDY